MSRKFKTLSIYLLIFVMASAFILPPNAEMPENQPNDMTYGDIFFRDISKECIEAEIEQQIEQMAQEVLDYFAGDLRWEPELRTVRGTARLTPVTGRVDIFIFAAQNTSNVYFRTSMIQPRVAR